jgi:hypothetical protein
MVKISGWRAIQGSGNQWLLEHLDRKKGKIIKEILRLSVSCSHFTFQRRRHQNADRRENPEIAGRPWRKKVGKRSSETSTVM